MATDETRTNFHQLCTAWSLLNEYHELRRIVRFRRKLEEQLSHADIPLTQVPWKSMVRSLLCQRMFSDNELKEMKDQTGACCTAEEIASSEISMNLLLENKQDDEFSLTDTWFEIDGLKKRFQQALDVLGASRRQHREISRRILGYPKDYREEGLGRLSSGDDNGEGFDLARVLTMEEQIRLRTGDLIELSGNRLHDAFYIYRLPEKGTWAQIQHMWSNHQIKPFTFQHSEVDPPQDEIILIPAMDEYGYGVPYVFATRPSALLPDGAAYKYVDINFPLVARHQDNETIALVQRHLQARLKDPVYYDKDVGEERSVDPVRFPQQYVACVNIHDGPEDNVTWTYRIHYNEKEIARDLNDNAVIFFSRRILEAEEQYRQRSSS